MENLVYMCIFSNREYIMLLRLLLESLKRFESTKTYDILVLTHRTFENDILEISKQLDISVLTYCLEYTSIVQAKSARLEIFDLPFTNRYKKFLYLDTDILVTNDLSDIFKHYLKDKLYVVKEGLIESQYWGGKLFDFENINPKTPGFSSGIMLFNNCYTIKKLFNVIHEHIFEYHKKHNLIGYVDQQFINYHFILQSLHDTQLLSPLCTNSPGTICNYYICHFAGSHGSVINKYNYMKSYMTQTVG